MTPFLRGARRGENNGAGRAAVAGSRGVAPGTSGEGGGAIAARDRGAGEAARRAQCCTVCFFSFFIQIIFKLIQFKTGQKWSSDA
jgi:hypothetical protein